MKTEQFASTSLSIGSTPMEMLRFRGQQEQEGALRDLAVQHGGSNIEANLWLPFAAREYKLSSDIRDYVLIPVPILFSDLPNTNGDSLSMPELLKFNPELGMQMFKTFRGKPTFYEHDNQDITKAKGIILDAFMRPLRRYGNGKYYKLVLLLAYDRTKDPLLVNSILSGENNAYSLGFYFKSYKCSICGQRYGANGLKNPCSHTAPKRPTYRMPDGRLAYRMCEDARGFETSVVGSPAYVPAISNVVLDLRKHMGIG